MGLAVLSARALHRRENSRCGERALFFWQNACTAGRRLGKSRGGSESRSGSSAFLLGDAEGPASSAPLCYVAGHFFSLFMW